MGSSHSPRGSATPPRVGVALFSLAASAVLLLGCGSDSGGADQTSSAAGGDAGATAVTIKDYIYKPAAITVPVGATVTFTNRDSTPHTATSKESGVFESGKSGKVTLDNSGTFAYYCVFHPFMKGTIVVE
jgi:plastocyanin